MVLKRCEWCGPQPYVSPERIARDIAAWEASDHPDRDWVLDRLRRQLEDNDEVPSSAWGNDSPDVAPKVRCPYCVGGTVEGTDVCPRCWGSSDGEAA